MDKQIMDYDPGLVGCGRWAKQKVRLTFGCWDYRKTFETIVGGNCLGFSVIEQAIINVFDELPYKSYDYRGQTLEITEIILERDNGDTLICEDEETKTYDWLKDMLISAEIVEIVPDKD